LLQFFRASVPLNVWLAKMQHNRESLFIKGQYKLKVTIYAASFLKSAKKVMADECVGQYLQIDA
jgi:hypothetical protein